MIATEVRNIDGVNFRVAGLDLRTERSVFIRLSKVLGPAIAELTRVTTLEAALPQVFSRLLEGLNEEEVDFLIDSFKGVTEVGATLTDGAALWTPYMETAFKNGVSSQFKWLWFCLEHQFSGFLGQGSGKLEEKLQKLLDRMRAKASGSSSPQT
jgi:hypothetical protein